MISLAGWKAPKERLGQDTPKDGPLPRPIRPDGLREQDLGAETPKGLNAPHHIEKYTLTLKNYLDNYRLVMKEVSWVWNLQWLSDTCNLSWFGPLSPTSSSIMPNWGFFYSNGVERLTRDCMMVS